MTPLETVIELKVYTKQDKYLETIKVFRAIKTKHDFKLYKKEQEIMYQKKYEQPVNIYYKTTKNPELEIETEDKPKIRTIVKYNKI